MKELKEIKFNDNLLFLHDNLVTSGILPQKAAELARSIVIKGETIVQGPVFAHKLTLQNGDLEIQGATYVQNELYVDTDYAGKAKFIKAVASAGSIASRAAKASISFGSDINAKSVTLYNAFVCGSIYADEITLSNCVVIGGVFATQELKIDGCLVGTFNAPSVSLSGDNGILLPSAFSIEPINASPMATLYNYSLADLGALYQGKEQSPESGKIKISLKDDEMKANLSDGEVNKALRSYTVVGKVLAADLIDSDKFQNHFLLTAAALGPQLLRTYNMSDGKTKITPESLRGFFFDILSGKTAVKPLDGHFSLSDITD
ncbi:MAG: hypothetical protein NC102_08390 [Clostridium sp.]|nr:hypothetical protein [Clostridium sp.]